MSAGPREALGLPDPDTLRLEDPELLAAYREFVDGLALAHEDDVVYADPELLSCYGGGGTIAVERYPRLRLLAALLGPDDELHRYLRARTDAPDDFARRWGWAPGHRHTLGVAHALEAFRTATTTRYHSRFREGRAAPACLDHLSMQLSSGPGMTWFADVKIHAWSADWAIVLFYEDLNEGEHAVFPKILGFARRDRYPQSAGRLLAGLPEHYRVSADAEVDGPNLLSACWKRHGGEGGFERKTGSGWRRSRSGDGRRRRGNAKRRPGPGTTRPRRGGRKISVRRSRSTSCRKRTACRGRSGWNRSSA